MKDIRPFEGTKAEQASDRLRDHTRLSILNWNAGLQRGNVTNRVVASHHVILLRDAESHFLEMAEIAAEQINIHHGADQLILFHRNTSEFGGVKTEEVVPGTSNQDSFGLK